MFNRKPAVHSSDCTRPHVCPSSGSNSARRIALISAGFPPLVDGIGDYTHCLSRELARTHSVAVFTSKGPDPESATLGEVIPCFDRHDQKSVKNLVAAVVAWRPDWVILQYNPFSYGRWGFNPFLPFAMRAISRQHGIRFALMVHEPFVPLSSWQFAIMTVWQRWQLWMLGRSADVVFFSIDPWVRRFRPWFPGKPVRHLPVGSNLPRVPMSRDEAKRRLGIEPDMMVIGLFGGISAARLPELIAMALKHATKSAPGVLLLYAGSEGSRLSGFLAGLPFRDDGYLSGEETSIRFAAMDIYLAPYFDGVSTRRTTLMAALQHEIPTVGTSGELTDNLLVRENGHSFLLSDVKDPDQFCIHTSHLIANATDRHTIGMHGRMLYEREFDWSQIVNRLMFQLADTAIA